MAQIIEGPGSFLGGLGKGLGVGLNNLLQSKLDQLSQRNQQFQTANALRQLSPELSREQAEQLAPLPVPLLQQYLKNMQTQQMGQQEANLLGNLLQQISQQQPQPNISQFGQAGDQAAQATAPTGGLGIQAPQRPAITLPAGASLRPGTALPIANFAATQQQNAVKNQMNAAKFQADEAERIASREQAKETYNLKRFGKKIDAINTEAPIAQNRLRAASEALDLLESAKFGTGPIAGSASQWSALVQGNPSLERYDQLLNEYIVDSLGDLTGQSSKYKAQLIENAKTKVTKTKAAQEKFWNDVANKQIKRLNEAYAQEDILLENNNKIPDNFDTELNRRLKLYEKMPDDMPDAKTLAEGSTGENDGIIWVVRNGRWAPLGKAL